MYDLNQSTTHDQIGICFLGYTYNAEFPIINTAALHGLLCVKLLAPTAPAVLNLGLFQLPGSINEAGVAGSINVAGVELLDQQNHYIGHYSGITLLLLYAIRLFKCIALICSSKKYIAMMRKMEKFSQLASYFI